MLSIELCKKILSKIDNKTINNEDIETMRDYLYIFASLQLEMGNTNNKIVTENE